MEKTTLELFKEYYGEIASLTPQHMIQKEIMQVAIDLLKIEMDRQFLLEKQRITEKNGKIIAEAFLDKMEEMKNGIDKPNPPC
jgi:hypothetical protein